MDDNLHSVFLITKDSSFCIGWFPKEVAEDIKKQSIQMNAGNGYVENVLIQDTGYPVSA